MDQDAFRSLLSAPRHGSSTQAKSGPSRNILGGHATKRGWGIKSKHGHEYKPKDETSKEETPAFVPRIQIKRPLDGKYKDRAEMRRAGVDDEYKPVEKLLEDFEKRKAEAGADAAKVEQTRAYLGGDATHSILVKGLDYALLAARKAELEREGEEVADEELEALLKDRDSGKGVKPGKLKDAQANGKMLKSDDALNSRFKSIAAKTAEAEAATGEKKKKKKKKKAKADVTGESGTVISPVVKSELANKTLPVEAERSPSPPRQAIEEDLGEDGDIFGDVGEYDLAAGIEDSSSQSDQGVGADKDVDMVSEDGWEAKRRGRSSPRSRGRRRSRSYDDNRRSRSLSNEGAFHRGGDRSRSPYRKVRPRYSSYSRSRSRPRYNDDAYRHHRQPRSPVRRRRSLSRSPSAHRRRRSYSRSRSPAHSRRAVSQNDPPRSRRRGSPLRHRRTPLSDSPPSRSRDLPPRRSRSRSPTPLLAARPLPFSRSPSESSDSADDTGHTTRRIGRLQPLSTSAIADVSSFLAADAESAKAEAKGIRKAKWRAAQGLAVQEGVGADSLKRKEVSEKGKANREYQLVMNKVNKEKGE